MAYKNWQTSDQAHQEQKTQINKIRNHNSNWRNTKKPKENYYDQYYEPRRKGQLFRNIQPTKSKKKQITRPISRNDIESVILKSKPKTLPINKTSRPDGFTGEFYKTYKKELLKLFQKSE